MRFPCITDVTVEITRQRKADPSITELKDAHAGRASPAVTIVIDGKELGSVKILIDYVLGWC